VRLAHYPTLRGYQAQLNGLIGWTSHARLPRITAPTLVLHGAEDQLIPPANGRTLAARIPGATHLELEDASHWLHSDRPAQVAAAIEAFVAFHAA
jgi:pimeloyl-ACP methyl ester carboxylesterase